MFDFEILRCADKRGFYVLWERGAAQQTQRFKTRNKANKFIEYMKQNEDKITLDYLKAFYKGL